MYGTGFELDTAATTVLVPGVGVRVVCAMFPGELCEVCDVGRLGCYLF